MISSDYLFSFDNYIFDLYGTLIDLSVDEHGDGTWEKWIEYLDNKNIRHPALPEFRKDFWDKDKEYRLRPTSYSYPEIEILEVYEELFLKYGNKPFSSEELSEISYRFRSSSMEYIRLFDAVPEFLTKLKALGKKVFILSNAQSSYTIPELLEFGFDKLTDDCLLSSDYRCMKPDKSFYDAIIKKHNLNPSKSVMLGDSETNDYEGAINAGLNAIWLAKDDAPGKFYKRFV